MPEPGRTGGDLSLTSWLGQWVWVLAGQDWAVLAMKCGSLGLPRQLSGKESPCNVGFLGLIPG